MPIIASLDDSRTLIHNLMKSLQEKQKTSVRLIETHISWVILTGQRAYKIKKPLDFEFLNFVELEQRQFYCTAEVKLNSRLAKNFYLKVLPITGSKEFPQLAGEGEPIEYAIEMLEFAQNELLLDYLESKKLSTEHIEATAKVLARFHAGLAGDSTSFFGTVQQVHQPVLQNVAQIRALISQPEDITNLEKHESWVNQFYKILQPVFAERKQQGWIRECHGDCHLGNIIWHDNQPVLFDCIEFNEAFRFTDTMADVAFLMMDLCDRGQTPLAWRFLNTYLEYLPDYEGLKVLPYYFAYRAMVRAKIALFEKNSVAQDEVQLHKLHKHFQHLLQLANSYIVPSTAQLIITHGCSGTGKTWLARQYSDQYSMIHLRSDVLRKQLFQLEPEQSAKAGYLDGIYHPTVSEKTYQYMQELAEKLLKAGYSVIVDASFLQYAQRQAFYDLGAQYNLITKILAPQVGYDEALKRVTIRQKDASDAYAEILYAQWASKEDLKNEEKERLLKDISTTIQNL